MSSITAAPTTMASDKDLAALRIRLAGKNIDPESLLATDYFNHFNEVIMLLEMIPSLPECLADAKAWSPKTYQQHFRDSVFADRDLAIEAYEKSPQQYRQPFDRIIARMDRLVVHAIREIEAVIDDPDRLALTASAASRSLQQLMDRATAIVHGRQATLGQEEIDDLMLPIDAGHPSMPGV